jgi:hypothetical protein
MPGQSPFRPGTPSEHIQSSTIGNYALEHGMPETLDPLPKVWIEGGDEAEPVLTSAKYDPYLRTVGKQRSSALSDVSRPM